MKTMKNRFRSPLGVPGRSGDMPRRAQRELGTPSWAVSDAKLAVLGAMLAAWTPNWQPRTFQTAPGTIPEPSLNTFVSSNGDRVDFSPFFNTCAEGLNLNFRAPAQCFVDFGERTQRLCARIEKHRKSTRFGLQHRVRRPWIERKTPRSGEKVRSKHLRGLRKF